MPITTHGLTKTSEYRAWSSMKLRCSESATGKNRRNYYERGITVCDRWLNSFESFIEDMGFKPTPQHSLERLDNDIGYTPDNCVWALPIDQIHNRRPTRYFTHESRYIYPTNHNTFRLVMVLPSGYRFAKTYDSYEEALDMRSQLEAEREMFCLLGGR